MPTKTDENLNSLQFFMYAPGGSTVRIEDIKPARIVDDPEECVTRLADMPIQFTMKAFVHNARGLMDYLCGRTWTKACWRHVRSMRRGKEKERRKKLKEAVHGV